MNRWPMIWLGLLVAALGLGAPALGVGVSEVLARIPFFRMVTDRLIGIPSGAADANRPNPFYERR